MLTCKVGLCSCTESLLAECPSWILTSPMTLMSYRGYMNPSSLKGVPRIFHWSQDRRTEGREGGVGSWGGGSTPSPSPRQWLKWLCEAGGLTWRSQDGADPISIPQQLIWRYLGIKQHSIDSITGGSYYNRGAQIGAGGLSPLAPLL